MKLLTKIVLGVCLIGGLSVKASPGSCNLWCLDKLYFGIDGGFTTGLGKAKNSYNVGTVGNGIATNAMFLPGWNVEGKIGIFCCPWLRTEASYTFFKSKYIWDAIFGGLTGEAATTAAFDAELHVHTLLFNTYVLLDRLCDCLRQNNNSCCSCVNPYIMGGLGAAWNDLHRINEFVSPVAGPVAFDSEYHQNTETNFAARFGIGLLVNLTCCMQFDAGVHATYIGTVQTGNFRTNDVGITQSVIPHVFRNNWLGSFDVGLVYRF